MRELDVLFVVATTHPQKTLHAENPYVNIQIRAAKTFRAKKFGHGLYGGWLLDTTVQAILLGQIF